MGQSNFPYLYFNNLTDATTDNEVMAIFGDVTVHLTDRLDTFLGYRYSDESLDFTYTQDRYSAMPVQDGVNFDLANFIPTVGPNRGSRSFGTGKSENLWAGRVGASFEFTPQISGYATASRGYIGSGVDLGNGSVGSPEDPGAAFLEPSISENFELGLKSQLFDDRLRLNATVFQTNTEDVQVTALVPGTNINIVQNAGDIEAKGLELDFEALLSDALSISGGASYLDAQIQNLSQQCYPNQAAEPNTRCIDGQQSVDGLPALNAPKYKVNMAATYTWDFPEAGFDMYLRGNVQYRDKTWFQLDHDPLATQDAFTLVDLALGFTSEDGQYDIRLFVNNLTDEYYCDNMVNGPYMRQGCQSSPIGAQRRVGVAIKSEF